MKTDLIALSKLLPITGGPFVELFLGKMNVRFAMKKERSVLLSMLVVEPRGSVVG